MKSLFIAAIALTLSYTPVQAQQNCRSYAEFVKISIEQNATMRYSYTSVNMRIVEVWANEEALILISRKNGVSCILDMGYPIGQPA